MTIEPVECYLAKKIVDLVSSTFKPMKSDVFWEKFNNAYNLALLAAIAYGIDAGPLPEKLPNPAILGAAVSDEKEAQTIKKRWWIIARVLSGLSELCTRPI